MDLRSAIEHCLDESGMTQQQLAAAAGIDQGSVSRLRRSVPRRNGMAVRRLCIYMQQAGYLQAPNQSTAALKEVWDGSAAHDEALARLILASSGLRAHEREESGDD